MAIRKLTKSEFLGTFNPPMRRLSEGESYGAISLKEYVTECVDEFELPISIDQLEIHHVYLSGNKQHTHVLLYFGQPNVYLIIIVQHEPDMVLGHYLQNLNEEYGLA